MTLHLPLTGQSACEPLEPRRLFAIGDVDTTFATDGRTDNVIPGDVSFLTRTIFLPDGKILFGGSAIFSLLAEQDQYYLRRFNADGTLDTTFGTGGEARGNFTPALGDDSRLENIALGPDGKITAGDRDVSVLARFDQNGTPDATFGGGGGNVVIAESAFDVQVQADGKPIVIGQERVIRRYLANGTPDPSFGGGDGVAESPITGGTFALTSVVRPQSDGKILLGGFVQDGEPRFAVARLNADGTPDTSFGGDGVVITAVAGAGEQSNSVNGHHPAPRRQDPRRRRDARNVPVGNGGNDTVRGGTGNDAADADELDDVLNVETVT